MSNLLSLDQASRVTGWAFFQDGLLKSYGKIIAEDDDIGERLFYIREEVLKLIKKFDINEIAFEDIQLQSNVSNNVQTFKILAEVFGVIYELITELQIPYHVVLSGTWKSTLQIEGKKRQEQKKNAQLFVQNTYGIKVTQDESDAICIGSHVLKKDSTKDGFDWSD